MRVKERRLSAHLSRWGAFRPTSARVRSAAPALAVLQQTFEVIEMNTVPVAEVERLAIADLTAAAGAEISRHTFAVQLIPAVFQLAPSQPLSLMLRVQHPPVRKRFAMARRPARRIDKGPDHLGLA